MEKLFLCFLGLGMQILRKLTSHHLVFLFPPDPKFFSDMSLYKK